ncbi:hypothetical protein BH11GEM2_BH11GEM2_31830 [soil metagenome]
MIVALGGSDVSGVLAVSVLEPFPVYFASEPVTLPPEFETERAAARLASLDQQVRAATAPSSGWHTAPVR